MTIGNVVILLPAYVGVVGARCLAWKRPVPAILLIIQLTIASPEF